MRSDCKISYILIIGALLMNLGLSFTYNPKEETENPLLKDSAEDGGIGFENIAQSLEWETNANPRLGGDPNAIKGGILTMHGGTEFPTTFRDIGKDSRHQINGLMASLQYEGLLGFDYETLEWEPSIATHWKISEDSLTYSFRIDPRARWADGQEIIAEDVAAYFKLLIDEGHKDPNTAMTYNDLFDIPVIESKYILKITAKKKDWRSFRYAAGFTPMPSYYLNKIDGAGYIEKYNFSFMPGSGPYEYDKENSKKGNEGHIMLKRRKDYWAKDHKRNQGLNNFDQIKFIFIEDENQQKVSFFNGDFDIYLSGRAQWWVEVLNKDNYNEIALGWVQRKKIFNYLPKGPSGIVFNTQKKRWDDIRMRKAFAHLFDVEKLNKRLFFGEYSRLNTFFFGTPYANPNNPYTEYSPSKALKLLNEIGWTRKPGNEWLTNSDGEIFEFDFLISQGWDRVMSTFQDDLKKVGIKMNFDQRDGTEAFSKIMKKEYEVAYQGWTGGFFPSPEGMMHSKYAEKVEVTNITSMAIPELDQLIDAYNKEWNAKKRIPLAHKIDSIAVNSFHYALGWTSPYGARMLHWNKFEMPEKGIYYAGDWRSPITLWWIASDKEKKLENAINSNSQLLIEPEIIDYWNLR